MLTYTFPGLHTAAVITLRQNGHRFAHDTFKRIFFNENIKVSIIISLKFVPNVPINNIPALVQIMAWRRPGGKPLSEIMLVKLPSHICVTRPQWVKWKGLPFYIIIVDIIINWKYTGYHIWNTHVCVFWFICVRSVRYYWIKKCRITMVTIAFIPYWQNVLWWTNGWCDGLSILLYFLYFKNI